MQYRWESHPLHEVRVFVRFDQSDSSVRFGFELSNSSGLFGSVRLAEDMGSSSVRELRFRAVGG